MFSHKILSKTFQTENAGKSNRKHKSFCNKQFRKITARNQSLAWYKLSSIQFF